MGLIAETLGGNIKKIAVVHSYIVGNSSVGGIVGDAGGNKLNSVASGSIIGFDNIIGGFAGVIRGDTLNNIVSANVKTKKNGAGILVGILFDDNIVLSNNIGIGSVQGNSIVSLLAQSSKNMINNNLSLSSINGNSLVSGIITDKTGFGASTIENNYWNTETTGQLIGLGVASGSQIGTTGVTSDAITDSEGVLSGLGFGVDDAWENIDNASYPVLKDNALDATEQTIFITHGLFRLATTDNAVITDQAVSNKVSNFLGDDNIQDDITLTASNFTDSTALTVIDTNLEASNDVSRVDYFACVDGVGAEEV